MTVTEGVIFGACNPLLDVSVTVKPEFLEKYGLKSNSAILGEDQHLKIYEDIKTEKLTEIEFIPGGSAQNSLRVASWILNHPNAATYMGCIGKDEYAEIMKTKSKEVGLNAVYQVNDNVHTGKCAVLITGESRSLVAHLGAANTFTVEHLDKPENWAYIEKAKIHYISGFFFTVCPAAIQQVAKYSLESKKTFAINLSAPFITDFFKDKIMEAYPYTDIVFGNDDEAKNFSKNILDSKSEDVHEIAKQMSQLPKLNDRKRIVIITQGDKPVVFAIGDQIKEIPVTKVEHSKIIDTNGAGDAFVGGFLAQFAKDESLEKCIDCGIWASTLIIQRSGCTFPDKMEYK